MAYLSSIVAWLARCLSSWKGLTYAAVNIAILVLRNGCSASVLPRSPISQQLADTNTRLGLNAESLLPTLTHFSFHVSDFPPSGLHLAGV